MSTTSIFSRFLYPADGVGVPLANLPNLEFLNDAPNNDVVYFVVNNEVRIESLTK
jgi:hypothetical protein